MSADDREQRRKHQIARNEALFREVNERVDEVSGSRSTETTDFLCECGNVDCTEAIALRDDEYEHVRSDPLHSPSSPGTRFPTWRISSPRTSASTSSGSTRARARSHV